MACALRHSIRRRSPAKIAEVTKSIPKHSSVGRSGARKTSAQSSGVYAPLNRKSARAGSTSAPHARLFASPQARAIKQEICAVGRKLWLRQLVDGNGGNISYRIGPNEVICTPTMVSKYDLTPADMCMVDLDGNQIAGKRAATSEILLHLEIYKNVPEAKSVVHCHPPHATAYAITAQVPASLLIPEYDIFVGKVVLAPYETPGTVEFAQTVLPHVRQHNVMLLKNHGAVSWADSVTLAEWNCEVLETYCAMLILARQLGAPLSYIPTPKAADLVELRKRKGFPDVNQGAPVPAPPARKKAAPAIPAGLSSADLEKIVERVTREVLQQMGISPPPRAQ